LVSKESYLHAYTHARTCSHTHTYAHTRYVRLGSGCASRDAARNVGHPAPTDLRPQTHH